MCNVMVSLVQFVPYLHRFGRSQENDQLLREGRQWPCLRRRFDARHGIDSGHVDEDASTAVDGGHGSDHLHGLDLRSSEAAACGRSEGGASADATGDRGGQEKERPHRWHKDCRLLALRFSLGAETAHGCLVLNRRATTAERHERDLNHPTLLCTL